VRGEAAKDGVETGAAKAWATGGLPTAERSVRVAASAEGGKTALVADWTTDASSSAPHNQSATERVGIGAGAAAVATSHWTAGQMTASDWTADASSAPQSRSAVTAAVDDLVDEIASSRRALLVTALRQPESLQKFVVAAAARGLAPRDVTDILRCTHTPRL